MCHKRALLGLVLTFGFSAAAQGPTPAPLVVHPLREGVSWVEGGGGNTGVIVGTDGVVIVDAKITAASGKELLADVATITPKPVKTVILTHSDRDHVNGLAGFPAGLTIIAQENDKKEQERAIAAGGKDAPAADRLPTQLVSKSDDRLTANGVPLQLLHWGPAHTSGDLVVYLPRQKIVFTGDIITNRPDPLIHLEKGGSSEGWIETARAIAALDADLFVPGHGNPQTKADVQQYVAHAEAKRRQISQLVGQSKSLDDIKSAVGDAPAPGGNAPAFATFTEVVYRELTQQK